MSRKEEMIAALTRRGVEEAAPAKVDAPEDDADQWSGLRPYEAFKAVDRQQTRLRLRPASAPWDQVKYQYLLHMPEDDRGTFLCLVFTFLVVVIRGRNLQPISSAIGRESCSVIWQFTPARFLPPTEPKAPFIESIDLRLETRGEVLQQAISEIAAKGRPAGAG